MLKRAQTLIELLAPQLRTISPRAVERIRLDNAILMARRVYLTDLDAFDAVLTKHQGDLPTAIQAIIDAAKSDKKQPFDAVKRLAADSASS